MADPRLSGRSGGGDPRLRGRTGSLGKPDTKKDRGGGGVGGFFSNLGGDIAGVITGFPAGVVRTVQHPIRTLEDIGESYKYMYGPLAATLAAPVGGTDQDWRDTFRRMYEHPLLPILDLSLLASRGATTGLAAGKATALGASTKGVAKAAITGRVPGPLRAIEYTLPSGTTVAGKTLPRHAGRAARAEAINKALNKLDPETRIIGEFARAARAVRTLERKGKLKNLVTPTLIVYAKAWGRLSPKERAAANIIGQLPNPKDINGWKAAIIGTGNEIGRELIRILDDPKVRQLTEEGLNNPKLAAAVESARMLGLRMQELMGLPNEIVEARRWMPVQLARGGRYIEPTPARLGEPTSELLAAERALAKTESLIEKARAGMMGAGEVGGPSRGQISKIETSIKNVRAKAKAEKRGTVALGRELSGVEAAIEKTRDKRMMGEQVDLGELASRRAELQTRWNSAKTRAAATESRLEDLNVSLANERTAATQAKAATGKEERLEDLLNAREEAIRRQARAKLGIVRKMELTGMVGGPTIKELLAEFGDVTPVYIPHVGVRPKRVSTSAEAGGGIGIPRKTGYERKNTGTLFLTGLLALEPDVLSPAYLAQVRKAHVEDLHDALLRSARPFAEDDVIPRGWRIIRQKPSERTPYMRQIEGQFLDELADIDETFDPQFFAKTAAEEVDEAGIRYAVPGEFARTIASEFSRTNSMFLKFLGRGTDVWRALVLNLRVGWLVNNAVGNHMLLALKYAGPDGLRAYLNMLSTTKGAMWVRRFIGRSEIKNTLTDAEWRELLPELPGGTFIGTQMPGGIGGKVSRVLQPTGRGLAPADRAIDYALRRVVGEVALRKEWKQRLPSDTRKFRQWTKEELAGDPKLTRHAVDEVHNTLGSFLNLGPAERGVVRRMIPFYAWYKAITTVTLKLPVDHPARALILAQIGQIGDEWSQEGGPLPTYLRGAIPLGGDKILKMMGPNPWATVPQVGSGVASLVTGRRTGARQLLGEFNPLIALPVASAVETAKGWEGKTIFDAYYELLRGLPPARVAFGPQYPSTLYKDQGTLAELLGFLGVGIRELNRREAAKRAKRGD